MRRSVYNKIAIVALVLGFGCKEKYIPPTVATANINSFLVVEGYINVAQDSTTIRLSHVRGINDEADVPPETGATVVVQNDAGENFPLTDEGGGTYSTPYIAGSTAAKYRLAITTTAGKQFYSDYVVYKPSPAIDSISWQQFDDGVHIYANTHDATGNSKYYKWDFVETFEYHAPFDSYFEFSNGAVVPRTKKVYVCYHSFPSTSILTASSTKLSSDVIYKRELEFIPASTEKLGVLYSTLVKQYTLTEEGNNYWENLKKNTESLGSLFDPQPSQVQGNIHCVNDPSITTVGFVTASSAQKQRIFISKKQLTDWRYPLDPTRICDTVHLNNDNTQHYAESGWVPVNYYTMFLVYATSPRCADCTLEGGVTDKPSFWP